MVVMDSPGRGTRSLSERKYKPAEETQRQIRDGSVEVDSTKENDPGCDGEVQCFCNNKGR